MKEKEKHFGVRELSNLAISSSSKFWSFAHTRILNKTVGKLSQLSIAASEQRTMKTTRPVSESPKRIHKKSAVLKSPHVIKLRQGRLSFPSKIQPQSSGNGEKSTMVEGSQLKVVKNWTNEGTVPSYPTIAGTSTKHREDIFTGTSKFGSMIELCMEDEHSNVRSTCDPISQDDGSEDRCSNISHHTKDTGSKRGVTHGPQHITNKPDSPHPSSSHLRLSFDDPDILIKNTTVDMHSTFDAQESNGNGTNQSRNEQTTLYTSFDESQNDKFGGQEDLSCDQVGPKACKVTVLTNLSKDDSDQEFTSMLEETITQNTLELTGSQDVSSKSIRGNDENPTPEETMEDSPKSLCILDDDRENQQTSSERPNESIHSSPGHHSDDQVYSSDDKELGEQSDLEVPPIVRKSKNKTYEEANQLVKNPLTLTKNRLRPTVSKHRFFQSDSEEPKTNPNRTNKPSGSILGQAIRAIGKRKRGRPPKIMDETRHRISNGKKGHRGRKSKRLRDGATSGVNQENHHTTHQPFVKRRYFGRMTRHRAASKPISTFGKTTAEALESSGRKNMEADKSGLHIGEIVWGSILGHGWWPGLVLDGESFGSEPPKIGHVWLFWFGDHRVSMVSLDKVRAFMAYFNTCCKVKGGKVYDQGIRECLEEVAIRLNYDTEGKMDLVSWAKNGFKGRQKCSHIYPKSENAIPEKLLKHVNAIKKMRDDSTSEEESDDGEEGSDNDSIDEASGTGKKKYANRPDSTIKRVWAGEMDIEDACISCEKPVEITAQHPLFHGGLCTECLEGVKESMFAFGDDGTYAYCAVCGNGGDLFVCDNRDCLRVFCVACIESLVGEEIVNKIEKDDKWQCFVCVEYSKDSHGLISPKSNYHSNIMQIFQPRRTGQNFKLPTPLDIRPIRVLSLFDGIGSAFLVLEQLGIEIEVYYASEVDDDAILVTQTRYPGRFEYVGDVRDLSTERLEELGPIDLLIGGSPCNDLSMVNPQRKGLLGGTGLLFFEFCRILLQLQIINRDRHLLWLFENVTFMAPEIKEAISNFLQCDPALWDSKFFTAQVRARYFWGNIPGLYSPPEIALAARRRSDLDSTLMGSRTAKVNKIRTVTTSSNSLMQGRGDFYPVAMDGKGDTLWIPELERLFGYPDHYTDVGNLVPSKRQKLLGKAWSLPVVKHLLTPLRQFFRSKPGLNNVGEEEDDPIELL